MDESGGRMVEEVNGAGNEDELAIAGIFQWFYTIKAWVPFGRMSASIFLAHFTFIW